MMAADLLGWGWIASTLVDLAAVTALAWLVMRTGRTRDAMLADQRATLDRLKGDLTQLLEDAEQRASVLAERVDAREQGLRTLLATLGTATPPAAPAPIDPAEARLLRDLEVSFAPSREARPE